LYFTSLPSFWITEKSMTWSKRTGVF